MSNNKEFKTLPIDEYEFIIETAKRTVLTRIATGRARCRSCGKVIKKGEEALNFQCEYGEFASSWVYIHKQKCI